MTETATPLDNDPAFEDRLDAMWTLDTRYNADGVDIDTRPDPEKRMVPTPDYLNHEIGELAGNTVKVVYESSEAAEVPVTVYDHEAESETDVDEAA